MAMIVYWRPSRSLLLTGLFLFITSFVPLSGHQASSTRAVLRAEWLKAVATHVLGSADVPAQSIAVWSDPDLRTATANLKDLREKPEWTALLRRAALLHTDIAIHLEPFITRSDRPEDQSVVQVIDGRADRIIAPSVHWDIARKLLGQVDPNPSVDDWVRLWYRSTSLHLAAKRDLASLATHLQMARFVFPSDAVVAFVSGCLHESLAAPDLQAVARNSGSTGGRATVIDSAEKELDQATTYFRRVLEIHPEFVEARIHLGRVLRLRSHHAQSAGELQRAIASTEDPLLAYYAHLFLADTEQARGRNEQARESAMRAASLFPRAQSPHLALTHLARRRGDREGALRSLETVLSLGRDDDDPWWGYNISHTRGVEALIAEMYKPFLDGRAK